jgi:transcriptional regulator with XRE-family HTH domain
MADNASWLTVRREEAKLTQEQLARRLREESLAAGDPDGARWDQSKISRYEKDPDRIPLGELLAILRELGIDDPTSVLVPAAPQEPETPDAGDPYAALRRDLASLRRYVSERDWTVDDAGVDIPDISDLLTLLDRLAEKPRIAFFGDFDAGKSTLVNTLLGQQSIPTSYQPETALITYIRHTDDRPAWLQEDVIVLNEGYRPELWRDEAHCLAHKVVAGGVDTLRTHGSNKGTAPTDSGAMYAVVFLDAPILRSCSIVDLPGTGNDARDELIATSEFPYEVAVFADQARGFMNQTALLRLGAVIKGLPPIETLDTDLPPLSNLFVVATHASADISDEVLSAEILSGARGRAWRQFAESVIEERSEATGQSITQEDFEGRFFVFYRELAKRREPLLQAIEGLLSSALPRAVAAEADSRIQAFREDSDESLTAMISFYQETMRDRADVQSHLGALLEAEPQRKRSVGNARKAVVQAIGRHRAEMREEMSEYIDEHTDADTIEDLIRRRFPDKKDAQKNAAPFILEKIQSKAEKEARKRTKAVTVLVQDFIGEYDHASMPSAGGLGSISVPFNAKGAFAGGLIGLVGVGGLAMWASTLGNLGAYIIVAKGVSVLSAVGLATGGTAAWTAAVAAIGGPVTLAIGIVVIGALLGWALFRSSWEERLAKKIASEMKSKKIEKTYLKGISKYWDETEAAFEAGADNAEKVWGQHLKDLQRIVDESSLEQLSELIERLGELRTFFLQLPWPGLTDGPDGNRQHG